MKFTEVQVLKNTNRELTEKLVKIYIICNAKALGCEKMRNESIQKCLNCENIVCKGSCTATAKYLDEAVNLAAVMTRKYEIQIKSQISEVCELKARNKELAERNSELKKENVRLKDFEKEYKSQVISNKQMQKKIEELQKC